MKIIVVGCGRVGSALAYRLYKQGHQVTVVDQDLSAFDNLPEDFLGRTIRGDVLVRNVLHRAEIESSDALVAVTSSDSLNALVAYIAKTEFQIQKVVARNYDPSQRPLQEAFGIPVAISVVTGTQHIEALLSESPVRVLTYDNKSKKGLYQLNVTDRWSGLSLQELFPDSSGTVIAWTRGGEPLEISPPQSLKAGDQLMISASREEMAALDRRLSPPEEHRS